MMKKLTLLFLAGIILCWPVFSSGQTHKDPAGISPSENNPKAFRMGEFHVAVQDLTFGITTGMNALSSISLRAGYSFTDMDMVFLSGRYSWYPREGYSMAFETGLYYRRYFREGPIQPFVQIGGGVGVIRFDQKNDVMDYQKVYGHFNAGAGVSFRYKRWGFELGIQSGFNQYSAGRIAIAPIVGVSFSF